MTHRLLTFFRLTLLAGALAAASPSHSPAQVQTYTIAWTQCLDAKIASFINVAVIGTDSAPVILRHEEVHRRQHADTIAVTGACIVYTEATQLLRAEVEAYCASDSVAVAVQKRDPVEVSAQTLWRLMGQFGRGRMHPSSISTAWEQGCPGSTHRE